MAIDPQVAIQAEMASRVLSKRRLLPFIQRMNDKYQAGWVHEDICRRLEKFSDDVNAKKSPRLMLLMPPRSGKSEIASRCFPAWHLGRFPDHEFIACSYNVSLAMSFSRKVKQILEDPNYQSVFPDTKLDPNNQSAEEWTVHQKRGGYVAAGISGGITGKGAHCVAADTMILTTDGPIDIATLYQLQSPPLVQTPLGPRRILAMTKSAPRSLFRLSLSSTLELTATGEHPIYLPDEGRYRTVEEIYGKTKGTDGANLRVVRLSVSEAEVRGGQSPQEGTHSVLLLGEVQSGAPCGEECQAVPDLQRAGVLEGARSQRDVLLQCVPPITCSVEAHDLPGVQRGISAEAFQAGVLRGDMCRLGALETNEGGGELELPNRQRIRLLVRPDQADSAQEGQKLRGMCEELPSTLPSYRRGQEQQHPGESDHAVQRAPHGAPQVTYDSVSVVVRAGGASDFVYDLQVEEAGCFFANEILVGNCLVIDDPVKSAEDADSADNREKVWEWYLSTAYSRLSPGGGVLLIMTFWHDDDLAGRLQLLMRTGSEDEHVDQFTVVKYPAIAEADEYLNLTTDLIEYDAPPEEPHTLLRKKGEALHPARYDLDKLLRIKAQNKGGRWWSALYQQNPVPDDGGYFEKFQFKRALGPAPTNCNVYIAWDFAISEKKQNDYTVGTVGLQDSDDVLHIVDQVRFRSGDAFFIVDAILTLATKWYSPSLQLGFEDGQIYRSLEALLKKRMRERRTYPSVQILKPLTDKLTRARALQGRMKQGMVSFTTQGDWYDYTRLEMLRFPAGVHDDCVDSLGWVALMAVGREPPAKPREKTPPSWRDKLAIAGRGSHMTA